MSENLFPRPRQSKRWQVTIDGSRFKVSCTQHETQSPTRAIFGQECPVLSESLPGRLFRPEATQQSAWQFEQSYVPS